MDNKQETENIAQQDGFSPFNENVIERDYTRPNVQGELDTSPIDEPIITPPSFEDLEASFQSNLENGEDEQQERPYSGKRTWGETSSGSANDSMYDLSNKEKKQGAEAMATTVLDGYKQAWGFGSKAIQISPRKIDKLVADGQLDPSVMIPTQGGDMPFKQWVVAYNQELDGALEVSDEFIEEAKPLLTEVFMKRNIGMTVEQRLMYMFGVDILQKSVTAYTISKQNKQLIESVTELSQNIKSSGTSQPKQKARPQQQEERTYSEPTPTEREYVEPEEKKPKKDVYEEVEVVIEDEPKTSTRGRKKSTPKEEVKLPEFGNEEILNHMEEIANEGKPKTTRGRRKK